MNYDALAVFFAVLTFGLVFVGILRYARDPVPVPLDDVSVRLKLYGGKAYMVTSEASELDAAFIQEWWTKATQTEQPK